MFANGIIISDAPPVNVTGYAWVKPLPDGTREWYIFDKDTQKWVLSDREPAPVLAATLAQAITDHTALPNVHHPANVGVSGSKTVGGYRLTFTNGLLTGFEPV